MSLYWNVSDVFLIIKLRLYVWERKIMKFSLYHIKSAYFLHDLWLLILTSIYIMWLKKQFCQISPLQKYFLPPFPYCTFWKDVIMHSPYLRKRNLCYTSLRKENLHELFEVLLLLFCPLITILREPAVFFLQY